MIVVPDILANAGGVAVSYLEWVQNLQNFYWEEDEINQRLTGIMKQSFAGVWDYAQGAGRADAAGRDDAGSGQGGRGRAAARHLALIRLRASA